MTNIQTITFQGQRVLTTAQLAESYSTNSERISKNFNENRTRYMEGKHFILLQGKELKGFKDDFRNSELVKKGASSLYLWTEKGAWMHAKSLNTDAAWDAYEMLVDSYYKITQQPQQLTARDQLKLIMQANEETAQRVDMIEQKVEFLHDNMRIAPLQEKILSDLVKQKALRALGGYNSPAYGNQSIRTKAYKAVWREFYNYFQITSYKALPQSAFEKAVDFISLWSPSAALKMDINSYNNQISFDNEVQTNDDELIFD